MPLASPNSLRPSFWTPKQISPNSLDLTLLLTIPSTQNTQQAIHEGRSKGLCYNCDDKWSPTHKCQGKQFLLLLCDDPVDAEDTIDPAKEPIDPGPSLDLTETILQNPSPYEHFQLSQATLIRYHPY